MAKRFVYEGSGATPLGATTSQLGLDEELGEQARTRLVLLAAVLGGIMLGGFVLRLVLAALEVGPTTTSGPSLGIRVVHTLLGIGLCAGLFAFVRREQTSPKTVLRVGLAFEVALAFLISLSAYAFAGGQGARDLMAPTWLTVWIVLFPLVVPCHPGKHLIASILAAATAPIALLIGQQMRDAGLPGDGSLVAALAPNGFAVLLAHFPARVMHQTGEVIHETKQAARSAGSYTLEKQIGVGGMGEVWLARHTVLPRPAAVKLILPDMLSESEEAEETLARFRQEAEVTSQLESPHTIELYDYGVTDDGAFYYVMEHLHGVDLDELIERGGPVSPARCVHILRQLCKSLEEAHAHGLVHRDIKPGNIFCCRVAREYDFVKLLDFGLVKRRKASDKEQSMGLTAAGMVVGTAVTMAPEQAQGLELDARTDIYAVGCVGYYLLTGDHVFNSMNAIEVIMDHMRTDPVPPSRRAQQIIPQDLEQVILACLAKEPADRPADATELRIKLAGCDVGRRWTIGQARRWWMKHLPEKVGGKA